MNCCPVCRKYIIGRSNIAEKLARCVFGVKNDDEETGKITLTGYREVKSSGGENIEVYHFNI